jgi:hypothetical protein
LSFQVWRLWCGLDFGSHFPPSSSDYPQGPSATECAQRDARGRADSDGRKEKKSKEKREREKKPENERMKEGSKKPRKKAKRD